jgi:membrane-bound lytic murein transglycosylase F
MQATRLPPLLPYFEEAAQQSGLDWRLLAALAYQESQWDPTAVSPNGAQGVLMLMPATARSLNVTDSFDARTNILGGARYLAEQRRRLPARISEPDRTYFALAMYNIGLGHVESARVITQKNGANPDRWQDVSNFLPLLEESYWNSQVASGYARGSEAADLVEKVRQYYQLLANYTPVIDESLLEDFGDAEPAATEASPANTDSATEEPNKDNAAAPAAAPTAPETPVS